MRSIVKNRPILFAFLLGVFTMIIVTVLSIEQGHHHYYRIYGGQDKISDVQIDQISDSGDEIYLIEQTGIDYENEYALIYFDAVDSGSGTLRLSYTRQTTDGETIQEMLEKKLIVSKFKIIYIGEGTYNHSGLSVISYGISIYSLLMMIYFIFRRKSIRKETQYSYAYMGTWSSQIFFTMIFIAYIITTVFTVMQKQAVDAIVMDSITRFLFMLMTAVTFPLVFIFAISMTISNISLIRHEGKRFNNMLGIIAGVGLLFMIAVIFILFIWFGSSGKPNTTIAVLYSIVTAFYLVFFSVLAGAIISGLQAGYHTPSMDKDFIIILGCAIREDGSLYPLIRGRVDSAIAFWKAQQLGTGKRAVFVPSGGQGSDEIISEGEAMKRYLLEQGIPEECILAETNSANTLENMKFSNKIIESINPSAKIAFSTTNYHVMRSGILASQAGVNAEGIGAPTKWYFWPNALLREVAGMFAYQPKVQILIMLLLALLAGAAGYAYSLI